MAKNKTTEELDHYDPLQWLGGIGSTAASGAAAGSAFGPVGTAVGGLAGGLAGAFNTYQNEQAYLEQQRQQLALEADLQSRDVYDRMMQQQGLASSAGRDAALNEARLAASRAGLSPGAAVGLERQVTREFAQDQAAQRPGMFLAAQQADLARRQQVLSEYETAQNLANNAAPPDYSELFGQVAGAAAQYGRMTEPTRAAAEAARAAQTEQAAMDAYYRGNPNADGLYPTGPGAINLFGPGLAGPMTNEQAAIWGQTPSETPVAPAVAPPGLVAPLTGGQLAVGWGQPASPAPVASQPAQNPAQTAPYAAKTPAPAGPRTSAAPKATPVLAAQPSPVNGAPSGPPAGASSVVEIEGYGPVSKQWVDAAASQDASVLLQGLETDLGGFPTGIEEDPTRYLFYRDPFSPVKSANFR